MSFGVARYLTLLVALTGLTGACTTSAQETFGFESQLAPTGVLSVDSFNGSIVLTRNPNISRVTGTVTVRASGFKEKADALAAVRDVAIIESGDAAQLNLSVGLPGGARRDRFGVDFDLQVPSGVLVTAITNDGAILVDGLAAGALTTTHGQVELRFSSGTTIVRTNDAPIIVDGHQGSLNLRTTHALIELFGVVGDIRATTINGFITARALPPFGAEILLATTNGGVELTLPFDYGAELVATTTPESMVFVEGLDFRPFFSAPGQLEGRLGNGAGLVDVRTTNADIVVRARR